MLRDQASFWIKKQNKTNIREGEKKKREEEEEKKNKRQPCKDKIMEGCKWSWDKYNARKLDVEAC